MLTGGNEVPHTDINDAFSTEAAPIHVVLDEWIQDVIGRACCAHQIGNYGYYTEGVGGMREVGGRSVVPATDGCDWQKRKELEDEETGRSVVLIVSMCFLGCFLAA